MNHPLLYEINTRNWLRSLSEREGRAITLANVPEKKLARWQGLGFTHIWAMGVWTTLSQCRSQALDNANLRATYDRLIPGWKPEDVSGSPYAIGDYTVPVALGGEAGLKSFRKKLKARGMKLLLDFVPNHLGLNHPWTISEPDHFVQSSTSVEGAFECTTSHGIRWLAHGKDPNFAPWPDTVQLNYRRPETRAAMTGLLQSIAERCDGVRCDMAMLPLNDVFERTWSHIPPIAPPPTNEFWPEAIETVKRNHPGFIFLAEAYWGLEPRLQSLGFDFTYGKMLHDCLRAKDFAGLQRGLLASPRQVLTASAHFLENHDEPRAASILSPAEQRSAALALLGLPGMRFLYEGQLEGRRLQVPVQLARWPKEPVQVEIRTMYEQLFGVLKESAIGRGEWNLLQPNGWPDNQSAQNFIIVQWQRAPKEFELVVVNLAPASSQCVVHLQVAKLGAHDWEMRDLLGAELYQRNGADLAANGLFLDVPPHGAQLFRFRAAQ